MRSTIACSPCGNPFDLNSTTDSGKKSTNAVFSSAGPNVFLRLLSGASEPFCSFYLSLCMPLCLCNLPSPY
eukprot:g10007.t1